MSSTIQTFSARTVDVLNPSPDMIALVDIAHGLACVNRFTGHLKAPLSVAQHSLIVSFLCDPEDARHGLLHDASEAYLADVASPVKRTPALEPYRQVERGLQDAIYERFGLPIAVPESVKVADRVALWWEACSGFVGGPARALWPGVEDDEATAAHVRALLANRLPNFLFPFQFLSWKEAELRFAARAKMLDLYEVPA